MKLKSIVYYILIDKAPVEEPDVCKWSHWFNGGNSIVKKEWVYKKVEISTVFLGLDYGYDEAEPKLFETMVFGGKYDGRQYRCTTWDRAVTQHKEAVQLVKESYKLPK